jgi:hypothetical protein
LPTHSQRGPLEVCTARVAIPSHAGATPAQRVATSSSGPGMRAVTSERHSRPTESMENAAKLRGPVGTAIEASMCFPPGAT